MTEEEAREVMGMMAELWPRSFTKARAAVWGEALRSLNFISTKQAVKEWFKGEGGNRFPSIAAIAARARALTPPMLGPPGKRFAGDPSLKTLRKIVGVGDGVPDCIVAARYSRLLYRQYVDSVQGEARERRREQVCRETLFWLHRAGCRPCKITSALAGVIVSDDGLRFDNAMTWLANEGEKILCERTDGQA